MRFQLTNIIKRTIFRFLRILSHFSLEVPTINEILNKALGFFLKMADFICWINGSGEQSHLSTIKYFLLQSQEWISLQEKVFLDVNSFQQFIHRSCVTQLLCLVVYMYFYGAVSTTLWAQRLYQSLSSIDGGRKTQNRSWVLQPNGNTTRRICEKQKLRNSA